MRIINDLNMYSINSYSQNSPSFGTVYTKSSVKILKSFVPDMILEDGFEFAQKAINNLAKAGKRKDNLILKFKDADDLGVGRLEVHAKHLSDKVNSFSKIDTPDTAIGEKDSQSFERITSFINSDDFVSKSNSTLAPNKKLTHQQKLRNFIGEKLHDLYQKAENKINAISEEIFCVSEKSDKMEWTVFENLKILGQNLFTKQKNPYQYNTKQKEEAKILTKMIDNLPTLNK